MKLKRIALAPFLLCAVIFGADTPKPSKADMKAAVSELLQACGELSPEVKAKTGIEAIGSCSKALKVERSASEVVQAGSLLASQRAELNYSLTDKQKSTAKGVDDAQQATTNASADLKKLCDSLGQDVGPKPKQANGLSYQVPGCIDRPKPTEKDAK